MGVIRTAKPLDHDEYPFLILGITANIGRTPLFGSTQVPTNYFHFTLILHFVTSDVTLQ